jgi:hypothetical protein
MGTLCNAIKFAALEWLELSPAYSLLGGFLFAVSPHSFPVLLVREFRC